MNIVLIGCGGIGGWAAQCLSKTLKENDVLELVDGDKIERKNLDRQLFTRRNVGQFKAQALAMKLEQDQFPGTIVTRDHYIGSSGWLASLERNPFPEYPIILVGVDNHPARNAALELADANLGQCIIGCNEYEDAEAYYYRAAWKGTDLDPRVYYPEIVTDTTDDPNKPPCTGEVLESAPQLAVANMNAASLMMWMFWYWTNNANKLSSEEAIAKRVIGVRNNAFAWEIIKQADKEAIQCPQAQLQ